MSITKETESLTEAMTILYDLAGTFACKNTVLWTFLSHAREHLRKRQEELFESLVSE